MCVALVPTLALALALTLMALVTRPGYRQRLLMSLALKQSVTARKHHAACLSSVLPANLLSRALPRRSLCSNNALADAFAGRDPTSCVSCLQLPIVKAACCNLIEQSLCEETVPSSLEIAER